MGKIFRYECRRLLWNKFFIGLAVVMLLYGALVLHAVTILGVSHTAPFSPWSFGDYLSRMLPLLWIGMLFFLTFYTSPKARRAAVLMDAAPMPPDIRGRTKICFIGVGSKLKRRKAALVKTGAEPTSVGGRRGYICIGMQVFAEKQDRRGAFFSKRKNAPRGNIKNSVQTWANVLK